MKQQMKILGSREISDPDGKASSQDQVLGNLREAECQAQEARRTRGEGRNFPKTIELSNRFVHEGWSSRMGGVLFIVLIV